MSNAVYSFLPWLRRGIGGLITGAPGPLRASVNVALKITGVPVTGNAPLEAPVSKNVELYGPGDIVGIDPRAIIRVDPHDWITNAEPNYLAHIEFYEEDFPWRYSPSAPFDASLKLQPWLALVVLAEGEFDEGKNLSNRPLPFIKVNNLSSMQPPDQLWAWAHVHVDESLSANDDEFVSPGMNAVLPKLGGILNANADRGYSRIVCPRKLSENTAYYAFLVPSFETGRLAGLGLDVSGVPLATKSAWSDGAAGPEPQLMPVYHRWHFRTGKSGDFEDLVRLLQPRTVDPKVGLRDMDVQNPSPIIPGILEENLHGVLKLGGALRAPKAEQTAVWIANEAWDAANPLWQEQHDEVQRVLHEIGAAEVEQVLVFNKSDLLEPSRQPRQEQDWMQGENGQQVPRVFVSATSGAGLPALRLSVTQWAQRRLNQGGASSSEGADPRFAPLDAAPAEPGLTLHSDDHV